MELTIEAEKKRKVKTDESLNRAVLLRFGTLKVLVVDRLKEESTSDQKTFNLVFEGNPNNVVEKAVNAGGSVVRTTNSGTTVKDPFGIAWTIGGKKAVTETTGTGVEEGSIEGVILGYVDGDNHYDVGQGIAVEHDLADIIRRVGEMDDDVIPEVDEDDDDNGDSSSLLHVYVMPRTAPPGTWRDFWIEDLDKNNFNDVQSAVEAVRQILTSRDGGVAEPEYFFIREGNQAYERWELDPSWDWEQFDMVVNGAIELVDGA